MQVLDVLDAVALLHIDVSLKLQAEERAVGDDVSVGDAEDHPVPDDGDSPAAVLGRSPPVGGEAAGGVHHGVLGVRLWVLLGALALLHAGLAGVECAAGTVRHVLNDELF